MCDEVREKLRTLTNTVPKQFLRSNDSCSTQLCNISALDAEKPLTNTVLKQSLRVWFLTSVSLLKQAGLQNSTIMVLNTRPPFKTRILARAHMYT